MASLTYLQLLRGNQPFRRLWVGQVISELGTWFNFIAGLGLVRAVSAAAPEATAIMIVGKMAPFGLFAPIAGAIADRWSRRTVMLFSDIARMIVALGFLLVRRPEDLWIAYTCTILGSMLSALFEAGKNAAMPTLTGEKGLLAGNALMFSTRFLFMTVGAALGGAASAKFGYGAAFVINSVSFAVSAVSVWLVPDDVLHDPNEVVSREKFGPLRTLGRVWKDMRDGAAYIVNDPLMAALIGFNILWALGGGANGLIFDRLGGVVFAGKHGLQTDAGVAILYTASGLGLSVGMLLARRIGAKIELQKATVPFMGWSIIVYGLMFATIGLMPSIWLVALVIFLSHTILSIEFAVHITLIMRVLPDNLRGRVSTMDRAAEIFMMSLSTAGASWSLHVISPATLAIFGGILSTSPGIVWLVLFARKKVRLPENAYYEELEEPANEAQVSAT